MTAAIVIQVVMALLFVGNAVMASLNLAIYLDRHTSANAAASLFGALICVLLAAVLARGPR